MNNNRKGYRKHFFRPPKRCYYRRKSRPVQLKECYIPLGPSTVLREGRGLRCLSLFDGIATALVALDKIGLKVDSYFSSEICESAIQVQRFHFHNRIIQLGAVEKVTEDLLGCIGPIHLLIGGSPCDNLSRVNPRRKGFDDPESSANLFFNFADIRDSLQDAATKQGSSFYYLFENTSSMDPCNRDFISGRLDAEPIEKDALDFTGMRRKRLFWTNIPQEEGIELPAPSKLQDHLKPYRTANFEILPTITTQSSSQRQGGVRPVSLHDGSQSDLLLPEQESLFGFLAHFTDVGNLSLTERRKLLGKSFCVQVVGELLKPLLSEFPRVTGE